MANYPQNPYPYGQNYPQPSYGVQMPPMAPQQTPQPSPQAQLRTVYSEAEARAAQIPIDGSACVFVDANNGRIYTKRFDYNNGSFPFDIYQRIQPSQQPTEQFVTVEQFQAWRAEIEGMIPKNAKGGVKAND